MNWRHYHPKFEYESLFKDIKWPWSGHKYFAYDLIANFKPKVVAELGTHYGTSLWSFSQAVKDKKLNTKLFAIDTWEGEEHAGFYSEEVFDKVKNIKNIFYQDLNINLVRKTFDNALLDFKNKSIDILHIDGLHTYEAVKHDFETWLPKMMDNGIILFHDIKVKENNFGVYKLWDELKDKYETVEFNHSFGLGVLFLDKALGKEIKIKEQEWQVNYSRIHKIKKILAFSFIKEKWAHVGFQKYLRNTGWMFGGKFLTLGISFFVGAYIARYLGPSNYGLLSYVISFVGLFGFLASFGIDNIVSREIIKDHAKKDELIGTGFYLKIIGSIMAIIAVFIISFFTTKDIFTLGLIWIFALNFIPQAFNILEIYFQSQVLSKKVVTAQVIANTISTILKILVIVFGKGIFWLVLIYLIETSIYAIILLFSFKKFGNHIRNWKFNMNIAKELLKDSWPLMLSTVAISVYMKIDQVMIKNMLGNEQVGIYAVAVKLSEVWYLIPVLICTSLFPSIVKAVNVGKEFLENRMKKLYFLMFWSSFTVAVGTTILAYPIIKILFGTVYLGAVTTLQIYVWAGLSVFLGIAVGQYILASNLIRISFYNTVFGAIINIILNMILIPKMGINGGAISTFVAYLIPTFGTLFFKETRSQGLLMLKSIIPFYK